MAHHQTIMLQKAYERNTPSSGIALNCSDKDKLSIVNKYPILQCTPDVPQHRGWESLM